MWKTLAVDPVNQLREVQRNGAVAQAKHADELLERIAASPYDSQLYEEAHSLYDAYVNDPYLTKTQEWMMPEAKPSTHALPEREQ